MEALGSAAAMRGTAQDWIINNHASIGGEIGDYSLTISSLTAGLNDTQIVHGTLEATYGPNTGMPASVGTVTVHLAP